MYVNRSIEEKNQNQNKHEANAKRNKRPKGSIIKVKEPQNKTKCWTIRQFKSDQTRIF